MAGRIHAAIAQGALDPAPAFAFASGDSHGALACFVGVVRDSHEGRAVEGLSYDVHDSLAATVLEVICAQAVGLWPEIDIYAAHAKGDLRVGQTSVIVVVGSPHREAAFSACRFAIEAIKERLPVWKKEHYRDGESRWLPGHSLVQNAGHTR